MPPKTHYARSGDVSIAYQVLGEGPSDLVMVFGYVSNIEVIWEEPMLARFLERLSQVRPPHRVRQARHRTVRPGQRHAEPGSAHGRRARRDGRRRIEAGGAYSAYPKAAPCACCSPRPTPSGAPD